jgi:hypothetical protein
MGDMFLTRIRSAKDERTWYELAMRWVACVCMVVALGSCKPDLYFIPGTGTLPDCNEAPSTDLSGSWFDQGTVTIRTAGCTGAAPDDAPPSCALNWTFTQTDNDVSIVVDEEYRLEGRLCGDQLYLRGGWWLPVEDEGFCTYEDDSAAEVGIMAEGNVLTYMPATAETLEQITGKLVVEGPCRADYDITFMRRPELPF